MYENDPHIYCSTLTFCSQNLAFFFHHFIIKIIRALPKAGLVCGRLSEASVMCVVCMMPWHNVSTSFSKLIIYRQFTNSLACMHAYMHAFGCMPVFLCMHVSIFKHEFSKRACSSKPHCHATVNVCRATYFNVTCMCCTFQLKSSDIIQRN